MIILLFSLRAAFHSISSCFLVNVEPFKSLKIFGRGYRPLITTLVEPQTPWFTFVFDSPVNYLLRLAFLADNINKNFFLTPVKTEGRLTQCPYVTKKITVIQIYVKSEFLCLTNQVF